jgi:long-chain acyl-CoA synthetase
MTASWSPTARETDALKRHAHVQTLQRVDAVWPWLADRHGAIAAVDAPHAAHPERFNFGELAERIATAAAAFRVRGVKEGDVVALFAENSPRWLVADQGLMRAGAADAVRGASAPVEELRYILTDCQATALVVQNAEVWRRLDLPPEQRALLRFVLQLEGEPAEGTIGWETFLSSGAGCDPVRPVGGREAVATVLYTSGTTGQPKGVPLTHANLLHQMSSLACVAYPEPGAPVLSVLPIWHAYERSASYYFFSCGCTQTYTTIKQLKKDLPRVRPIAMATVPRLWEAVQAGFEDVLKTFPPSRQRLLRAALANSAAQRNAMRTARNLLLDPVSASGRLRALGFAALRWPLHALASALIWPKLRRQLSGGQLAYPISGGGAIAPHIDAFFEAVGIELLVGYGLTETSPVVSCRRPWRNIRGSSGLPMPQTEFRIVDPDNGQPLGFRQRGRVMVRGPQVMAGYLGKPEASAKVTIVLSSGENIEPGPLEEALVASPLIEQVMLVGQDERQLGALIVPRAEAILAWAAEAGVSVAQDLGGQPGEPALLKLLMRECNRLLKQRAGSRGDERLTGVVLVDPFSIENGLLTQTLKQRRDRITRRDQHLIDALYGR